MKKLLIVDDHEQILDVLKEYAMKNNYEVYCARDGQEALDLFHKYEIDAILLDVMIPKIDGFEVCRRIRKESMVPIIMITARGEDFERIMGLDIGADDYVVKPFSLSEVMARLRAILRRVDVKDERSETCVRRSNLMISLNEYKVMINDQEVKLTKKEIEILWLLVTHPKQVFTRGQILDEVWGYDYYGDERTVDTHVKRLRSKIDQYEHSEWNITTVRGVGYKFEVIYA